MKKIFILMLIMTSFFGGIVKVKAVENMGIYISPPFIDLEIKDKQEKEFLLELGNNGDVSQTLEIRVVDFGSLDESGGVAFLSSNEQSGDKKYALASWISLEKDRVTVEPGGKEKIKVTIVDKESLIPGGHYGAVLATVKSEEDKKGESVGLNQSMASLIYVLKSGGERKSLLFRNIEWNKNWLQINNQVKLRFENNGNVHVVPRGKVEIKNFQNEIVAKGIINEGSGKILPETFRVFPVTIKKLSSWIWPGKYKMEVSHRFESQDSFVVYKKSFIYIGKEGVIFGGIGLIGVLFFLVNIWRKYRR